MPTCSGALPALELACHLIVRRRTFHARAFFAFLAATTVCIVLLPLFVTDTASYGAAQEVCFDRSFEKWNVIHLDVNHPRYRPDWDMDEDATYHLLPQYIFHSVSTIVSLFGFGVWLFFSPHQSDVAKDLDRTRTSPTSIAYPPLPFFWFIIHVLLVSHVSCLLVGSYFALQWLGNLIVTASTLTVCTSSPAVNTAVFFAVTLPATCLSCIGTNIFCHRYLVEKARVMIKMYDDVNLLSYFFSLPLPTACLPFS
jgi:hypothetical protein